MSHEFFDGEMSPRVYSGTLERCTGMAQSQGQHTLWGNSSSAVCHGTACCFLPGAPACFFGLEMKRAPSAFANFMTLDTQATLSIPYGKALLIQLLPDCNFLEDGNPCNSFALFNFCKFHKTRHSRHVVHSIWHCP